MFIDTYESLCKQRGVSCSKAAQEMGINKGTVSVWRNKGTRPQAAQLEKIAEYFGVSVDYLLTGVKENPTSVSADGVDELDNEALDIIHRLPPEKRAAGLAMLRGLLNN